MNKMETLRQMLDFETRRSRVSSDLLAAGYCPLMRAEMNRWGFECSKPAGQVDCRKSSDCSVYSSQIGILNARKAVAQVGAQA
jgi:hypothetical protein